jgi:hypothetical protein
MYTSWENHYSRKYGKCFVRAGRHFLYAGHPDLNIIEFIDAFQGTELARWGSEGDPLDSDCHIGYQRARCGAVLVFISDHMKK